LTPITTTDGRALIAVWVIDATDASLGPHSELQVSIFVSDLPLAPVEPHALQVLQLLLLREDVHMLCCGLWNNTPPVVAYNREHLSLPAVLARSAFEYDDAGDMTTYTFWDGEQVLAGVWSLRNMAGDDATLG
jgi:hypothetical protein